MPDQFDDPSGTMTGMADMPARDDVVTEVRDLLSYVISEEDRQRKLEREVLEFDGIDQWDGDARIARAGGRDDQTGDVIPAKPTMTLELQDHVVEKALAEYQQQQLGGTIQAETAEKPSRVTAYTQGLIKKIQRKSNATEARKWALERTIKAGRGGWEIAWDYVEKQPTAEMGPRALDMEIIERRILDQGTIYWDPSAQQADKSDADFCIVSYWISDRKWKLMFPGKKLQMPARTLGEEGEAIKNEWFQFDQKQRQLRIAHYYKVNYQRRELYWIPGRGVVMGDQATEEMRDMPGAVKREFATRTVTKYVVDGTQRLKEESVPGPNIPIVPTVGKEYMVEGEYFTKGMLHKMMDACRGVNLLASTLIEINARIPRAPYIAPAGTIEPYREQWNNIYTKNQTVVEYAPMMKGDTLLPGPQRQDLEPAVQGVQQSLQQMRDMLMAISGTVDPTTRANYPYDRSGIAIDGLEKQGSVGTARYIDNMAQVSIRRETEIVLGMIPRIYDRRGRRLWIPGDTDNIESPIIIKVPFVRGPDGQPMPVPCPKCGGSGVLPAQAPMMGRLVTQQAPQAVPCDLCGGEGIAPKDTVDEYQIPGTDTAQKVQYIDFSEHMSVNIEVGQLRESEQQAAHENMIKLAGLLGAENPALPAVATEIFRGLGTPSGNRVADRLDQMFPAPPDPGEMSPAQLMAQIQQMGQELEQMQAVNGELQKIIETDQVKAEGQQQIAHIKGEHATNLERLRGVMRERELAAKAGTDEEREEREALLQRIEQRSAQLHDRAMEVLQQRGRMELAGAKGDVDLEREGKRGETAVDVAEIQADASAAAKKEG